MCVEREIKVALLGKAISKSLDDGFLAQGFSKSLCAGCVADSLRLVWSRFQPSGELKLMEVGSGDVGMPGDKYRIRLRIAGKYRLLPYGENKPNFLCGEVALLPCQELCCGTSCPKKTTMQQ